LNIAGGPSYSVPEPWDGSIKDEGFWDDTQICKKCKKKVMFFNSGKKKDHTCTHCWRVVTI